MESCKLEIEKAPTKTVLFPHIILMNKRFSSIHERMAFLFICPCTSLSKLHHAISIFRGILKIEGRHLISLKVLKRPYYLDQVSLEASLCQHLISLIVVKPPYYVKD